MGSERCRGVTENAPWYAHRTIRCGTAILGFSLAGLLSGCTAALTPPEPAAPKNPPAAQASPSEEHIPKGSNLYDAGAERAWSVELSSAPSFVGYNETSNTLVVAEDGIGSLRDARISAYSVTAKGDTLLEWTTDIQGAKSVTGMDLGKDSIYLNIVARDGRSDFLVLSADKGGVLSQWSRSNQLDSDVPQIVTAVDEGVGVLKSGSTRIRAAILDSAGEVLDSEDIFLDAEDDIGSAVQSNGDSVSVVDAFSAQGLPAIARRVIYPSLAVVPDGLCYRAVDGLVCVDDSPSAEQGETAQAPQIAVTEYDLSGHSMRATLADEGTAAAQLFLVSANADATAREIAEALLADYDSTAHESSSSSDGAKDSESKSASDEGDALEHGDSESAKESSDEDALSDGTADSQSQSSSAADSDIRERHPAMLYDGEWIAQEQWAAPVELTGGGKSIKYAVKSQAPLYQLSSGAIINARSGRQLTTDGAIGYAGVGESASMLFEYDHGVLYYLDPLDDANSAGGTSQSSSKK